MFGLVFLGTLGNASPHSLLTAWGSSLPAAVLFLATAAGLAPTLPCAGAAASPSCSRAGAAVALARRALLLRRLWRGRIGFWSALIAIFPPAANDPDFPVLASIPNGALLLACALVATPRNRGRLHRRLGRLGGGGSEEEEAAAVAALVGGADPDKALVAAATLFRCVPVCELVAADLPARAQGARPRPAPTATSPRTSPRRRRRGRGDSLPEP